MQTKLLGTSIIDIYTSYHITVFRGDSETPPKRMHAEIYAI